MILGVDFWVEKWLKNSFKKKNYLAKNRYSLSLIHYSVVHDAKDTIPYTTFMHIKRPSHALLEKNTVRVSTQID